MASTNHTTNYNLSQYVGSDKPTYLGDYNSDMSKIDTQMKTNADNNTVTDAKIGILSNLTTETQSNVVAAINEVDSNCDTNTTAISNTNTNIGTLSNLDTTNKTSIVNAINELVGKFNINNFKNNLTITLTDVSGTAPSITAAATEMSSAYNADGSIGKIYGNIRLEGQGSGLASYKIIISDTGLRPETDINLNGCAFQCIKRNSTADFRSQNMTYTLKTDGTIEISHYINNDETRIINFVACIIFATDFGDSPTP